MLILAGTKENEGKRKQRKGWEPKGARAVRKGRKSGRQNTLERSHREGQPLRARYCVREEKTGLYTQVSGCG